MRSARCLLAVVLTALAATLGVVANAGPAAACSCISSDIARSAQWAHAVFTGELIRSAATEGEFAYTFAVERVYDGAVGPVAEVRSSPPCGLERMETGRRYVIFAGTVENVLTSGLCSGTARAGVPYVEQVEQRLGPGAAPRDVDPDDGGSTVADDGNRTTLLVVAGISAAVILLALAAGIVRSARRA